MSKTIGEKREELDRFLESVLRACVNGNLSLDTAHKSLLHLLSAAMRNNTTEFCRFTRLPVQWLEEYLSNLHMNRSEQSCANRHAVELSSMEYVRLERYLEELLTTYCIGKLNINEIMERLKNLLVTAERDDQTEFSRLIWLPVQRGLSGD